MTGVIVFYGLCALAAAWMAMLVIDFVGAALSSMREDRRRDA